MKYLFPVLCLLFIQCISKEKKQAPTEENETVQKGENVKKDTQVITPEELPEQITAPDFDTTLWEEITRLDPTVFT